MEELRRTFLEKLKTSKEDLIRLINKERDSIRPLLEYAHTNNHFLIHKVCCHDYPDVLHLLILEGGDINALNLQSLTPLQVAAEHGCVSTVSFLLRSEECDLQKFPLTSQTSPHYLATVHGHVDVVRELNDFAQSECPDITEALSQRSVGSLLLHAACLSGSVGMVRLWYGSGVDVNSPVLIVTDLTNCENLTPLYAACSVNGLEVIEFLLDRGAHVTEAIVETYPGLMRGVLKAGFPSTESSSGAPEDKPVINLTGKHLCKLHPSWLFPFLERLTSIDISHNHLKALPNCLPWSCPSLETLNVSYNNIQLLSAAIHGCDFNSLRLRTADFSNNKLSDIPKDLFKIESLEMLNLSNNSVRYLYNTRNTDCEIKSPKERMAHFIKSSDAPSSSRQTWNCSKLTTLNLSNNKLELLSDDLLKSCISLKTLDASHNQLYKFPMPWACHMMTLKLSHNNMASLPSNVSQFWGMTLKTLDLSHNQISDLPESVVSLYALESLFLSHNVLTHIAPPEVWSCDKLQELHLSHNRLTNSPVPSPTSPKSPFTRGSLFWRRSQESYEVSEAFQTELVFPRFLSERLHSLYLDNNNLYSVPSNVEDLRHLQTLTLHNNPNLSHLPKELAKLTSCRTISLEGCNIPQSAIPSHLIKGASYSAGGLLAHLRMQLRDCERCDRLKLIVLGKERRGKTSVVNALLGEEERPTHTMISIRQWTLSPCAALRRKKEDHPDIQMTVWDFPGLSQLMDIHQCFFTENTLYLLVWDVTAGEEGVQELAKWLENIQSRVLEATVLIVGTHKDKLGMDSHKSGKFLNGLAVSIRKRYYGRLYPTLGPVSFVSCCQGALQGIQDLQETIYNTAIGLRDHSKRMFLVSNLIGQQVPRSYLQLETVLREEAKRRRQDGKPPVLVQDEFDVVFEGVTDNDMDTPEEIALAVKFLHELGVVLHFNDQMRGLNSLYFLDPEWLCDLLSQVIINKEGQQCIMNGIIQRNELRLLFDPVKFPHSHLDQYLELLERFEIALMLDKDRLLIPCKVSQEKFGCVTVSENIGETVYRFYRLAIVPAGFWSRLITKILVSIHRFTGNWRVNKVDNNNTGRADARKTSFHKSFHNSKGFRLSKVVPIYWREGIKVMHAWGQFTVEAVKWECTSVGRSATTNTGILISVLSAAEDFSALGFLVDEIDNLMEEWYTGMEHGVKLALCPQCCPADTDMVFSPERLGDVRHFSVLACAAVCRSANTVKCPVTNADIPLKKLVPELILTDLPQKLHVVASQLELKVDRASVLGEGAFGSVHIGTCSEKEVAVKVFPVGLEELRRREMGKEGPNGGASPAEDSGTGSTESSQSSTKSSQSEDRSSVLSDESEMAQLETESKGLKALYSLCEMRKEVALLSRLHHPCVVSLMGVCLPLTSIVMERAPLGNLRQVIEQHMDPDLYQQTLAKIKDRVFGTVFSRSLTYKIVYQITKALHYLHVNEVIYRDLKPCNVLVWSLDTEATVNVKLSDYGISKFSTPQGLVGNCGTPGYQAPEVSVGIAYDEKVDVFSLGIVIYETLSGMLPYNTSLVPFEITKHVKEGSRPSLQTKDYRVDTKLPVFERMMERCWQSVPADRPSASSLLSQLRDHSCLALKRKILGPTPHQHGNLDCAYIYTSETKGSELAWLWEGAGRQRQYSILDTRRGQYVVRAQSSPGPRVTSMTKANDYMWIANQSGQIEVFGQKGAGVPEPLGRWDVPSCPMCLLYQRVSDKSRQMPSLSPRQDQDYVEYVYCGLEEGRLLVYTSVGVNPLHRNPKPAEMRWSILESTVLAQGRPINKVILVNGGSELWAACGSQLVVIAVQTQKIEHQISVAVSDVGWSGASEITDLVTANGRVWCCCTNNLNVLEINTESRELLSSLLCHNPSVSDYISSPVLDRNKMQESSCETTSPSRSDMPEEPKTVKHSTKRLHCPSEKQDVDMPDTLEEINKEEPETDESVQPPLLPRGQPALPPRRSLSGQQMIQRNRTTLSTVRTRLHSNRNDQTRREVPPSAPDRTTKPPTITGKELDKKETESSSKGRNVAEHSHPKSASTDGDDDGAAQHGLTQHKSLRLLTVKDSLWVGLPSGDIAVISVDRKNSYGQVLSMLSSVYEMVENPAGGLAHLLAAGEDTVMAVDTVESGKTGLFLWEAWGTHEVAEFTKYAVKLRKLELELIRKSSL